MRCMWTPARAFFVRAGESTLSLTSIVSPPGCLTQVDLCEVFGAPNAMFDTVVVCLAGVLCTLGSFSTLRAGVLVRAAACAQSSERPSPALAGTQP